MRRIGFGIDKDGFFPVLLDGDTAVVRMTSEKSCDDAMRKGISWSEKEQLSVDVVRIDTRFLK